MVFVGKVLNGTVVLPPGAHLPNGVEVEVRPMPVRHENTAPRDAWRFPEGRHLGGFHAPAEDWRLLAHEADA